MASAYCPDCDAKIVRNPLPKLGDKLNCPECDTELEVISLDPLELDWVYDWSWDDEGWDDEEED